MSRLQQGLRVVWLAALALVVACDLMLTDPATTPSALEIQLQIEGEPLGATAEAFQRVTRVLVRLTIPDSVPRDTIVSVTPDDDAVRTGVKLRPAEQVDGLSILTRLGSEEVWLFEGETVASIEPGLPAEAEIALEPIPAQVSPDRDPVVISNPGETAQLESAVLYASGDTIPGLAGTWSSLSPAVMTVTSGGLATAVSVGEGELVVAYDTLSPDTVTAIVSSVDNGTVTPADTSVASGSTVQYSVTFRDAFGNVLTDRATTWSTDDATVATIDPDTGLLTAVAPGTVTVTATAEGVDATTGLTVFEPDLSIDDLTVTEGDTGTTAAVFTVTLSTASAQQITVDYATADGTATAPDDYTATSGTLTFAVGGALTQQVTVPVLGDLFDEGTSETFTVELSGAVNATIGAGSGLGTITDDDDAPSLSIDDVTVLEGDAASVDAVFTVTLSAASAQEVSVDYATADGTATAPDDYTATSGTLTFAAGTTSQTISVPFSDDALDEPDETFTVGLTNATNATIADASGLGTITDDDGAPSLSIDDVTVLEGDAASVDAVFTVTLSAASAQEVSVDYATADGTATAPDDYTATSGTLTFAAGTTSQTISVPFSDDALDEPDETFTVGLTNATNATIADASGLGTITDDDGAPSLSIDDVTVLEGDAASVDAVFTVTLSAASAQEVSVDYATADGTATAPEDYTATSGTLTFAAGTTSQTISVAFSDDALDEADETFTVELTNAVNATIADGSGTGTITDDDAAPSVSIDDVTVLEGDAGTTTADFTVTLSAASGQQVTVDFATADGTATAGSDYTATSGTLTFPAGTTSQTISVAFSDDALDEADETFTVGLTNATNATIADNSGTGTITDDDGSSSVEWINANGGLWSNGANWSTGSAPASGDSVEITLDGTYTVDVDVDPVVANLTVGGASGSQTLSASSGTIDVAGTLAVQGTGLLVFNTLTLNAAGVTNSSSFTQSWTSVTTGAPISNDGIIGFGGSSSLTGALTTTGGSLLQLTGTAELTIADGFTNNGVISLEGDNLFTVTAGTLTNQSGATIESLNSGSTVSASLDNAGSLTIGTSAGLTWSQASTSIANNGIITANGPLTVQSGESVTNSGTIDLVSSDVTFAMTSTGTFSTSGTISTGTGTTLIVSGGTFDYTGGSFAVGGSVRLANLTANFTPTMTLGTNGPEVLTLNGVTLNAPSVTNPATLNQEWTDLTAGADIINEGTISFSGASSLNGTLTTAVGSSIGLGGSAGVTVPSGFTNNGTLTLTSNSGVTTSTGPLVNADGAVIEVTGTGSGIGGDLQNVGIVDIAADFLLDGQLIVPSTSSGTFTGSGGAISATAVDIDGAIFDNMPLTITDGTITAFDNVTFQNMDATATQLTVTHPGAATPFAFSGVSFLTTPTTGLYISANDNAADGNTLGIDLTNSVPTDGSAETATSGGAVVRWLDASTPGFTVTESGGTTVVDESGTTDDFSVVLDEQPFDDVVLTVTSADLGEATVSPATLTFTSLSWSTPRTVTVTGVDDSVADGDQVTAVTISVDDANSDDQFDPLADQTVSATTTDDEVAGFTVTESGGTTVVDESGTTDDFTVVLDAQPLSNVVISVTSGDLGEVITDSDTLTFTPDNWNLAQTVTVAGVSDTPLDDGDQLTAVTLSVDDVNSDDQFDLVADQTVTVTTVDIDPLMAFTSGTTGNNDVWLRTGGGDLTQLTTNPEADWDPEWSPDGQQIVFSSARDGLNDHVWIMNADGTGQTALTRDPVQHVYPSWSPDGSQIVFARDTANLRDIWVMNRDGSNPTELMANEFEDSQPTWSPDGRQIAFFSDRTGTWQIFTMGADGSNPTNRSNNDAFEFFPAWSPDGTQIAFVSNRHDPGNFNNWQIYVLDTTEFAVTRLTNNAAQDLQPAWTPDGRIVFSSDRDGDQEIYIMNRDGTNQVRLTTIDGADQFPSIKPEG